MKKILAWLIAFALWAPLAHAQTSSNTRSFDIFQKFQEAKIGLRRLPSPGVTTCPGKRRRHNVCDVNTLIAIMPKEGGPISYVTRYGNGASTLGYDIVRGNRNGINTRITVTHPPNMIVLGVKRPIQIQGVWRDVTYVPFSESINTPEVRARGRAYLQQLLEEARQQLRAERIPSRARSGTLVADTVPDDVAETLATIEHIDPSRCATEPMPLLMNEVWAIIGANQDDAYDYSVSPAAGARGLFQFVSKTYGAIQHRYPQAHLERNFVRGMDHHANAAKASLLLFDDILMSLNGIVPWDHSDTSRREMGAMIAAGYNGGPDEVRHAVARDPTSWRWVIAHEETRWYIFKFDHVWDLTHGNI